MIDTFKGLIANQYEAAFCTMNTCIDQCPDPSWRAKVGNLAFCQAVFHALFFADCYLGENTESLRQQPFHRNNKDFFGDYEELEDRVQVAMYEKGPIKAYLDHCRAKAAVTIAAEAADTLTARSGFDWCAFSRAELYVYTIRHLQHHAAQLSLRLRIDHDENIPWVGSGWRDA